MRVRSSVTAEHRKNPSACWFRTICIAQVLWFSACSGGFQAEPLVEYSTELTIQGASPQSLVRQLRAGIYVVCGLAIVASIALLALDHFLGGVISAKVVRLT